MTDERYLDRSHEREEPAAWTATSGRGLVVTAHYRASAAGAELLRSGGTAADAAAAAALALGVVEPAGSGLGGMACAMIHLAGQRRTIALLAPCRAPRRVTPERLAGRPRYRGHHVAAVPTQVTLLQHLVERHGRCSTAEVIAPARRLAEEGFPLTPLQAALAQRYGRTLLRRRFAPWLLRPDGALADPGQSMVRPQLAWTLGRLADAGFRDFYEGEIADRIVRDQVDHDGFIRADDLREVPAPSELEPLAGRFGDMAVHALPPPGGGPTLVQLLGLWDELANGVDPDAPDGAVTMARVIRSARLDRREHVKAGGDPAALADPTRIAAAAARLRDSGETTHVCVVDGRGDVVSLTTSIERSFGAKAAVADLDILLNGYLRTFKLTNRRHPFYLRPGAPARSNAAPSILCRDGHPAVAIGSTGSERLASGVLGVLARLDVRGPFAASAAPRLHATPDGTVFVETRPGDEAKLAALAAAGFRVVPWEPWSFRSGGLHLAARDGDAWTGVADPRRDGAAVAADGSGPRDPA